MTKGVNGVYIYQFIIEALSPVYFGDSQQGKLIRNSCGKSFLPGSAIGGALRDYLENIGVCEETILYFLGGVENTKEKTFRESRIHISDGEISQYEEVCKKEGTAINSARGSALNNHKYEIEHLPKGINITFTVEWGTQYQERQSLENFEEIIDKWGQGFKSQAIKLGGQQNNGFGQFTLVSIEKKAYVFSCEADLEQYIFKPDEIQFETYRIKHNNSKTEIKNEYIFSMVGYFPYGVYQNFKDRGRKTTYETTGLQKNSDGYYYIPSTSIKGVIRHEVSILLKRFIASDERVSKKVEAFFGSTEQKGKVIFQDIVFDNEAEEIKVKRYKKDERDRRKILEKEEKDMVYIKIDRLTGGAVETALKHQEEVSGGAKIQLNLMVPSIDPNPYLFPLIYVLRRIGSGLTPLGGRTSIGLGEFTASELKISGPIDLNIKTDLVTNQKDMLKLEKFFDDFKRWCENE